MTFKALNLCGAIMHALHEKGYQSPTAVQQQAILAPTRELAIQVFDNLKFYGKNLPLKSTVIYGGASRFNQVKEIRKGMDILVATPGRLQDLAKSGISAEAIHGNKSQNARQRSLTNFKRSSTRVLVATDIAARGIDIADLPFAINYELPASAETYTHRIGRTGRAGKTGSALSFCDREERGYLNNINRISKEKLAVVEHPFNYQHEHKAKSSL